MNLRFQTLLSSLALSTLTALTAIGAPASAAGPASPAGVGCALGAAAASPAGCGDWHGYAYGDEAGRNGVLALYSPGDSPVHLRTIRVRGPRVAWVPPGYPTTHGTVGWRVAIWTSPSAIGPWTRAWSSGLRRIDADRVGEPEHFQPRAVRLPQSVRTGHVRVTSELVWLAADGSTILSDRHRYGRYGLVETAETAPAFRHHDATTRGSVPVRWIP